MHQTNVPVCTQAYGSIGLLHITLLAGAHEASNSIGAVSKPTAVMFQYAFVYITAVVNTISLVASHTLAGVAAICVNTLCQVMTHCCVHRTLINVSAIEAISIKPIIAGAIVASLRVITAGKLTAQILINGTLIYISAVVIFRGIAIAWHTLTGV
jgi:hypothetical protein